MEAESKTTEQGEKKGGKRMRIEKGVKFNGIKVDVGVAEIIEADDRYVRYRYLKTGSTHQVGRKAFERRDVKEVKTNE